jgi:GTP-binding protein EngB required for normal cell division
MFWYCTIVALKYTLIAACAGTLYLLRKRLLKFFMSRVVRVYNAVFRTNYATWEQITYGALGQYLRVSSNDKKPNIIVFGPSGSGKSSFLNKLAEKDVAATSLTAQGCTFENNSYEFSSLNIIDTVGLDEGERNSTVKSTVAIKNLISLMRKTSGGISLLVYFNTYPRINEVAKKNIALFRDCICDQKVPLLLVISKCEDVRRDFKRNDWKTSQNKQAALDALSVDPENIVCISCNDTDSILELSEKMNSMQLPKAHIVYSKGFSLKKLIGKVVKYLFGIDAEDKRLKEMLIELGWSECDSTFISTVLVN